MALANEDDNFIKSGEGEEANSVQKVLEWLASLQHVIVDGNSINTGALLKAVNSNIDKHTSIFSISGSPDSINSASKHSNYTKKNNFTRPKLVTVNENTTSKLPSRGLALKNWTICKNSSSVFELKGDRVSVNDGKVFEEDFSAGEILSRPQTCNIRTTKGVFALIGKIQDPKKKIPAEVKKHFNKNFPSNWKKILQNHWNVTINGSKVDNCSEDSVGKSILESTNNSTVSFIKDKDESSVGFENKKRTRKKVESRNDSVCCNDKIISKVNNGKTKRHDKDNLLHLKKWTLVNDSTCILLKGYLYCPLTDELSDELYSAGTVTSVKQYGQVVTSNGSYLLLGSLHDPDNLIPDEVRKQFINGFPKTWKKIFHEHWSTADSSSSESVERKARKGLIKKRDVSPSPKPPKVNAKKNIPDGSKIVNKKLLLKSKIPVKIRKNVKNANAENSVKPSKVEAESSRQENKRNLRRNMKKIAENNKENSNISHQSNGSEANSPEKAPGRQKNKLEGARISRGKKKEISKIKVNKKRQSISIMKKNVNCDPFGKKQGNNKKGKKKDNLMRNFIADMGVNMSGFDGHINKTSDFFRTFDNDCIDDGIALNSFKEVSLGGCVRSAQKKMKGSKSCGKETPLGKHVADVFSHSLASNHSVHSQSLHSARSSPDTKRNDIVKRIQKLNKGKKNTNKTTKKQDTKSKRFGNAEVNAVFKQITKKTNALSATPKIIKKIFRKRKFPYDLDQDDDDDDDDDSMNIDSSANKSDLENDFL